MQESILDRIEFLKEKIHRKYKKHLSSQEWDEDEILELGKNLRSKVRSESNKAKLARKRIEYYGGYDAILDQILTEPKTAQIKL